MSYLHSIDFTFRELEIIKLLKKGHSTKEIAFFLNLSDFTVKKHRENIASKALTKGRREFRKFIIEFQLPSI